MRILVLGGDGFLGWPASLHLSALGHAVAIADDFARRGADAEAGIDSLTPIGSLNDRVAAWSGPPLAVHTLDVATDHDALRDLLAGLRPDAVVHLAQQASGAYSVRSATHRRYTVDNNVSATHNLLAALVETGVDAHVVCGLGSATGVAGLTEALGRQLLDHYARVDGVRATALRQGSLWGIQTPLTAADERLANRFDHDADHATPLNRLLVQVAFEAPLDVGFDGTLDLLHVVDACRGIEAALADPPARGDGVRAVEQVTESWSAHELADLVDAPPEAVGDPIRISREPVLAVVELAQRYRDRVDAPRPDALSVGG